MDTVYKEWGEFSSKLERTFLTLVLEEFLTLGIEIFHKFQFEKWRIY